MVKVQEGGYDDRVAKPRIGRPLDMINLMSALLPGKLQASSPPAIGGISVRARDRLSHRPDANVGSFGRGN